MTKNIIKGIVPIFLLLLGACFADQPSGTHSEVAAQPVVATESPAQAAGADYAFDNPDVSFALPEELKEISGLTILSNGYLGAVQDEEGIFFLLNRATGAIEARHAFGEAGDYEGIEQVGDTVFVLQSNGTLIALTSWTEATPQTRTYPTDLKGKNDTEGLGYDSTKGHLLIACKEEPGGDIDNDKKAIYAFDLARGTLTPEPAFVIDTKALEEQLGKDGKFKPSALSIHPLSGDLYVLSATAHAIVVLGEKGAIQHIWSLSEVTFEQPEGLTFLPDGTLFIASEGDEGPAMLYQFAYNSAVR